MTHEATGDSVLDPSAPAGRSSESWSIGAFRASALGDADLPLAIGRASLHRAPHIRDARGSLTLGEAPTHLPFTPQRYFLIFDVPADAVRGEHANRYPELLVCVHGECVVEVDDGAERAEIVLDRPDVALYLPALVWARQYRYSPGGVLLVLASTPYDPTDVIDDYEQFRKIVADG